MEGLREKRAVENFKYEIYQLRDFKDADDPVRFLRFVNYDIAKGKVRWENYRKVYDGVIEVFIPGRSNLAILERLFEKFNIDHPKDFRGHSLSVSDIVVIEGLAYYCDSIGWVPLSKEKDGVLYE